MALVLKQNSRFKQDLKEVEYKLEQKVDRLENKLTIRMFALSGVIIASLTFIISIMKFID